jgi:hypothetical protein
MTAHLIVRAQVSDERDKEPFDRWYQGEHLPQAIAAFRAVRAWRGWSEIDPSLHLAFYEFADLAELQAAINSDGMKELVSEFDRAWGTRVPRSREVVAAVQALAA